MICSWVNLLFFMSVILLTVDGLHQLQIGTAGGGQLTHTDQARSDSKNSQSHIPELSSA